MNFFLRREAQSPITSERACDTSLKHTQQMTEEKKKRRDGGKSVFPLCCSVQKKKRVNIYSEHFEIAGNKKAPRQPGLLPTGKSGTPVENAVLPAEDNLISFGCTGKIYTSSFKSVQANVV